MGMVNVSELLINIESNDELKKLISSSQNGMHGTIQVLGWIARTNNMRGEKAEPNPILSCR